MKNKNGQRRYWCFNLLPLLSINAKRNKNKQSHPLREDIVAKLARKKEHERTSTTFGIVKLQDMLLEYGSMHPNSSGGNYMA